MVVVRLLHTLELESEVMGPKRVWLPFEEGFPPQCPEVEPLGLGAPIGPTEVRPIDWKHIPAFPVVLRQLQVSPSDLLEIVVYDGT